MKETVLRFIAAINTQDIDRIAEMMAEDFVFIDTYACEVHGREQMRAGWIGYFEWFPDYKIEVADVFPGEHAVAVFGFASGTYRGERTPDKRKYWRLPAAWKAIAENGQIKLWQVVCDSKIPCEVMERFDRDKVPQVDPKLKQEG